MIFDNFCNPENCRNCDGCSNSHRLMDDEYIDDCLNALNTYTNQPVINPIICCGTEIKEGVCKTCGKEFKKK